MKVKVAQSSPTLCNPVGYIYSPWDSPGQNTGVGSCSLLQGIFPTQGSNPSLQHCRWILPQLSYKGSPRILDWVAYPFSSRSSQESNRGLLRCRQILYQLSYQRSQEPFFLTSPDQLFKTMRTASSWAEFILSGCRILQALFQGPRILRPDWATCGRSYFSLTREECWLSLDFSTVTSAVDLSRARAWLTTIHATTYVRVWLCGFTVNHYMFLFPFCKLCIFLGESFPMKYFLD